MTPLLLGTGALVALGLLLALYATQLEPYRPVTRRVKLSVPEGWPRLTILHLSDLHVRVANKRLYRAQERFLRALPSQPDLVCVTGDVCERVGDAPLAAALLNQVRPRLATLVVLGNHEHHAPKPNSVEQSTRHGWGALARLTWRLFGVRLHSSGTAEAYAIAEIINAAGPRVLLNEGLRFEIEQRSLWVAGLDSIWGGHAQGGAALDGRRDGEACLGLVHEPEGAPGLLARGVDLVLAGHTHGGQVRLPLLGALYTLRVDPRIGIAAGVQRLGRGVLHISAGLGQTVALRFNCPPEATWIECVPAAPGRDPSETPLEHDEPARRDEATASW